MQIDIRDAIKKLETGRELKDWQTQFWYESECGLLASKQIIVSRVSMRAERIARYMQRHQLPFYMPWLLQLLKLHQHKGGNVKRDIIAFKYLLLDDCMKKRLEWTKVMDAHCEGLAEEAYQKHRADIAKKVSQAHKEKTRRG